MSMRALLIATVALLAADVAIAQERSPHDVLTSDCYDDNLTDRCDPGHQRERRQQFNLHSIEDLAAANVETRRVFFVDGYGRDMPVVSFERQGGQSPELIVSVVVGSEARVVEMRAPITAAVWQDVVQRTRAFYQLPEPVQPSRREGNDQPTSICLHSWVFTMEAADPGQRTPVRARTEDACNRGFVREPAFDLARIAYESLPYCQALNLSHYRNEVAALHSCALLEGDRLAAAQALNRYTDMQNTRRAVRFGIVGANHNTAPDAYLTAGSELDWTGEIARGPVAVTAVWDREQLASKFYIRRVIGDSADRVRIDGFVIEEHEVGARAADAEQIWTRSAGADFLLERTRVGPFTSSSE